MFQFLTQAFDFNPVTFFVFYTSLYPCLQLQLCYQWRDFNIKFKRGHTAYFSNNNAILRT